MKGKISSLVVLAIVVGGVGFVNAQPASVTRYKSFYGTLLLYQYDSTGTCSGQTTVDAGHTMQYKVDSGSWTDCTITTGTGSFQYTPSDTGLHTIYVRAKPQCSDSISANRHQPCVVNGFSYLYNSRNLNSFDFGTNIRTYLCTLSPGRNAIRKPGTQ